MSAGFRSIRPSRRATPWLFLLPALIVYTFAVLIPIIATFVLSFFEWDGFGDVVPVGLDNYRRALDDDIFRSSFVHIAIYIGLTIIVEVGVGLLLAGLVTARRGAPGIYRIAFFAPVMLPLVVVAVVWKFIYNPDFGLLNAALGFVGLDSAQQIWLGDTRFALLAITVVSGWVFSGFYMAIFYAAFQQLPGEMIEAARLDGANEWQIFWRIKVPNIRHVTRIAVLLAITGGFQGFDLFYVMTNGGPYNATEIPTTYLVRVVFRNQDVGYGAAQAVLITGTVLVLIGVLTLWRKRAVRKEALA